MNSIRSIRCYVRWRLIPRLRVWWRLSSYLDPTKCEHCDRRGLWWPTPGMTAYHYEGPTNAPDDPNRWSFYCRRCAYDHDEYWRAMWDEYHASRG